MKNFVKYARYYDLLYRDKDYGKEADYVDRIIRRYSDGCNRTLLDIGCGTGSHDIWFVKKGYRVTGIDRAPRMIDIARLRFPAEDGVKFIKSDASTFNLNRRFDVIVSLFHVMSYMTDNRRLAGSLKNIRRHLKKNGLFIFDFWYGPAVLAQKAEKKTKVVSDENVVVRRTAVPRLDSGKNTVDVNYTTVISDREGRHSEIVKENHKMRYFFLPELDRALMESGFKVVKSFNWLSLKEGLSEKSWSGVIIAKKG